MSTNTLPLISVIIPIYNVGEYLECCLNTIVNQTYKNLEIILINDGSTDNSLEIIKKWEKRDKRIISVNQANGGLSNARNTGIKVSHGDYLTFVDSDDFVSKDYIEYLYSLLKSDNFQSSLSMCSLMNVSGKNGKKRNMGNGQEVKLTGKECIKKMCYHNLVDTCAYAKLGKRELYDNEFFPEGKLFEDIGSTYKLFEKCSYIICGFKAKYFYMIRPNSIVTGKFNPSKLDLLEMTDKMASSVNKLYPDLKKATLRRQVYARFSTLNQTLGEKNIKDIQDQLISYIKKNKKNVLSDPLTPKRDRIAYHCLSFGISFYRLTWNIYMKLKG